MGSEKEREIHTNLKTTKYYNETVFKKNGDVQTPDLDMNSLFPATIDPTGAPRA